MSSDTTDIAHKGIMYLAYPAPKSTPAICTHDVLREIMEESAKDEDTGFVVVDVRGTNFQEHCIKGSINLPAESFYTAIPTLSKVFADRSIIFYSSQVDGSDRRCAAWYQDCENA